MLRHVAKPRGFRFDTTAGGDARPRPAQTDPAQARLGGRGGRGSGLTVRADGRFLIPVHRAFRRYRTAHPTAHLIVHRYLLGLELSENRLNADEFRLEAFHVLPGRASFAPTEQEHERIIPQGHT